MEDRTTIFEVEDPYGKIWSFFDDFLAIRVDYVEGKTRKYTACCDDGLCNSPTQSEYMN
jgi:hypothetical protein